MWSYRNRLRELGVIQTDLEYVERFYYPFSFIPSRMFFIQDRMGKIPHFLPMKEPTPAWPKPNYKYNTLGVEQGFQDCCFKRAQDLLDMGKTVNVLWSGGLDSTTVLLSLLVMAKDRKQIRVVCSYDSLIESGPLFDRYIRPTGVRHFVHERMGRQNLYKKLDLDPANDIITDGSTGDQLYGLQTFFGVDQSSKNPSTAPLIGLFWNRDLLDTPWEEALDQITPKAQEIMDFMAPALEACPYKPTLYRDLLWWYKANFNWTNHIYTNIICTPMKLRGISHKFFDSPEFMCWAMAHGPSIIEERPDKMPQRQFIFNVTQNAEYSFMKQRFRSSGDILPKNMMFYLEDGRMIFIEDILKKDFKW